MDENKSKALAAALSQIEKQFGKGSIMRLGDADIEKDIDVVSTGSLGLADTVSVHRHIKIEQVPGRGNETAGNKRIS